MLKIFKNLKYKNQKKGIALVIAITVTTLLLSISLSISNIVLRQIKITNVNNESKSAFFAADSAIECAMYYDTVAIMNTNDPLNPINTNKIFDSSVFGSVGIDLVQNAVRCGNYTSGTPPASGKPLGVKKNINEPTKIITNFDIVYDNDMCASVEIVKTDVETTIKASGYNVGVNDTGDGCDLSNLDKKRVVERGLTLTY